jgi:HlyD family secretion protein
VLALDEPRQRHQRLGHGFRVIVRVVIWQADDVVTIPLGALLRHGEDWATYVVRDGRAVLRPLRVGERNLRAAQVVAGLEPGERIVLHPNDRLSDGARVRAR